MKNIIKKILMSRNLELRRVAGGEEYFEEEFIKIYKMVRRYTLCPRERLYSLYQSVRYVILNDIQGDFVECGVWKGGCCMLIALTLEELGITDRKIYLYDTYQGMTKPTEEDVALCSNQKQIDVWNEKQNGEFSDWCDVGVEEVRNAMLMTEYPKENIILVKGKVEDTLKKHPHEKIALLRLDTDWYESTLAEMVHLFPVLESRGILISDDYRHLAGSRKAIDDYLKEKGISLLLNRVDDHSITSVK